MAPASADIFSFYCFLEFENANGRIVYHGPSIANFIISRFPCHASSFPSNTTVILEEIGTVLGVNVELG